MQGRPPKEPHPSWWLASILGAGPVLVEDVKSAAKRDGYGWRTIQRAAKNIGVIARKTGWEGGWEWRRITECDESLVEFTPRQQERRRKDAEEALRRRAEGGARVADHQRNTTSGFQMPCPASDCENGGRVCDLCGCGGGDDGYGGYCRECGGSGERWRDCELCAGNGMLFVDDILVRVLVDRIERLTAR